MEDFHITSKGKAKPTNAAAKKSVALERAKDNKPYKPRGWSKELMNDFNTEEKRRHTKKWTPKSKKEHLQKEHEKFDER